VTAISFVALGTSLPDLFASKQAVTDGTDADAAVGNVTGSNSVNVFLGLGVPYVIAAIYYNSSGDKFCGACMLMHSRHSGWTARQTDGWPH
jgi:solute carrier family 8 (sodium/calcium exchanger)